MLLVAVLGRVLQQARSRAGSVLPPDLFALPLLSKEMIIITTDHLPHASCPQHH